MPDPSLQEAQRCGRHADVCQRVDEAEARKKAAVLNDELEAAIQIKSEITAIKAELAPETEVASWRDHVANGARDSSLRGTAERLEQRCRCMDDSFGRAALAVAVRNFGRCCPPAGPPKSLSELPGLLLRKRRAEQMSRAVEAASSGSARRTLEALTACLRAVARLLGACTEHLRELSGPEWSDEEREEAAGSDEFKGLLQGLGAARRILWRLGLAAELFLPGGDAAAVDDGDVAAADAAKLRELHAGAAQRLGEARSAWARLEAELAGLRVTLAAWEPDECFEVGGGPGAGQARSAPLCALCLLPAMPMGGLGAGSSEDGGAVSSLWKGGLWHVNCANFWARHTVGLLADLGLADPFA
ncbi:unnamed protein product [Prorocentrum cordatum]|uniref:Uncharacterized protein n=1 Tax=Prorocentrum cordatum TaxID=2364126 RepID=A0ABN9SW47_9DINO|nr:unnamed protein product [Polarella glacialis]